MKRKPNTVFVSVLIISFLLIANGCRVRVDVADPARAARGVAQLATESRSAEEADVKEEKLFSDIIPVFADSKVKYDDKIGFEEYYLVTSDSTIKAIAGNIRRQFCEAPEGRSPLEIMRYYQRTIEELEGEIIFQSRAPRSIEIHDQSFESYFNKERVSRGMSTYVWDFYRFPRSISEFLAAKISHEGKDMYIAIAAGRGGGGTEYHGVRFEIVTIVD